MGSRTGLWVPHQGAVPHSESPLRAELGAQGKLSRRDEVWGKELCRLWEGEAASGGVPSTGTAFAS